MRPFLPSLMLYLAPLRHIRVGALLILATVSGTEGAVAFSRSDWSGGYLTPVNARLTDGEKSEFGSQRILPSFPGAALARPKTSVEIQASRLPETELDPAWGVEALKEFSNDGRLRVRSQTTAKINSSLPPQTRVMAQSVYLPWIPPKPIQKFNAQGDESLKEASPAPSPEQTPVESISSQSLELEPASQAPSPVSKPPTVGQAPTGENPDSVVFPSSEPLRPAPQPAQANPLALPQLPQNPAPNQLNPMGNPLLFPTKPSEVKTNIRQAITLNQAIELALQNNPQLQAARIELLREEAGLMVARSALFPTLSTEFSLSRDSSPAAQFQNELASQNAQEVGGTPNLQRETSTNAVGNVQLIYNIYTGGERSAQIARAEKQVRNGQLQVEVIAEQTRFDATDRYYALQGADAQVAIAQATVEDTSQSLRDARLLEQAGLGTRFDVLRAEGDLATANEALTRSIADQRNARRRLAQILNAGQQVELTAADEIQEAGEWSLPLEQSIVQAYKNRAELEQRLIQSEISEQDSLIALAAIKPQVDFLANYDYQNNFDSSVGVVDGYSFAARVRWTFFDGGRAFAQARRAYREMDLAQTQFAQQRDQIRFDVEESYYNLIANKENIASTRTNVVRFEEALRLARLRFQAGVGTQTDVINAQRDLANARGRFLQAIIGYNQSLNSLQRAVSNLPNNTLFTVQP